MCVFSITVIYSDFLLSQRRPSSPRAGAAFSCKRSFQKEFRVIIFGFGALYNCADFKGDDLGIYEVDERMMNDDLDIEKETAALKVADNESTAWR